MDIGFTLNKNPIYLGIKTDNVHIRSELKKLSREELEEFINKESKFIINLRISLGHILGTLDQYPRSEVNKQLINFIDALLNGE